MKGINEGLSSILAGIRIVRQSRRIALVLLISALAGCGEDSFVTTTDGASQKGDGTTTPVPISNDPVVNSITLLASSPSMGSGRSDSVTVSAVVKDDNNNLMEGVDIIFSSTGGSIEVLSSTTSKAGVATAKLTAYDDPINRILSVTASVVGTNAQTSNVDVEVSGTTVSASGANSLVFNSSTVLTIFVRDSDGLGLSNQTVTLNSRSRNEISDTTVITGTSGQAQVSIKAIQGGADVITVSALGATTEFNLNVSNDEFSFTSPTLDDLDVEFTHNISVSWSSGGNPVNGEVVNFSTTRGTLSSGSVTTVNGTASVSINSINSGPAVITARTANGTSASIVKEFVATIPASITLQSDKTNIGPNGEQVALMAIVRDANNNLVKNAVINFSILKDSSRGGISNDTNTTDSQGRATSVYTSTTATTANEGVIIQAKIQGTDCLVQQSLCNTVALTVAQKELFVVLGTGNKIFIQSPTQYRYPYTALVTDAAGVAVANTAVDISLVSTGYRTGFLQYDAGATSNRVIVADVCPNEDRNLDGNLELGDANVLTEDTNGNGVLDPRNVASVTGSVVTDSNGFANIDIIYAKQFAIWVSVKLTATVGLVVGTESSDTATFTLFPEAKEFASEDNPPSFESPWGATSTCSQELFHVPFGVVATPSSTNADQIRLSWLPLNQAISYNIYRSTVSGFTPAAGNLLAIDAVSTYLDVGLTTGTSYYYVVTGVFLPGVLDPNNPSLIEGGPSREATAVAPAAPVAPAAAL